jgi:sugar phosphate isomerase/epimerase
MHDESNRRHFIAQAMALLGALRWNGRNPAHAAEPVFQGQFAICNETFGDWPFEKAFAFAAECGYQGIEFAPFTMASDVREIAPRRRQEVRRQLQAAGLEAVGLHWLLARTEGFHLTSPDRDVRRRTAAYLGELARFCADLGGKLLVFGSPQQRNLADGVSREQGLQYASEVFREADMAFEQAGVQLAVEPLSPKSTNFLSRAAEAVELVQRVGSPRCRLILDCAAMADEMQPQFELIRAHRRHLVHFHANDPNRQGPGFGALDFVPIFQALREIDYRGWVSVEVFDFTPGAERLARDSMTYMKRCQVSPDA